MSEKRQFRSMGKRTFFIYHIKWIAKYKFKDIFWSIIRNYKETFHNYSKLAFESSRYLNNWVDLEIKCYEKVNGLSPDNSHAEALVSNILQDLLAHSHKICDRKIPYSKSFE